MTFNNRETATILFALQFLASNLEDLTSDLSRGEPLSDHFADTDNPDEDFINDLCQRINAPKPAPKYSIYFEKNERPVFRDLIKKFAHRMFAILGNEDAWESTWMKTNDWDVNAWKDRTGTIHFSIYKIENGHVNMDMEASGWLERL